MFLGEYAAKLDGKGRVIFPAVLRRQNETEDRGTYVLKRGIYVPNYVLYTLEDFQRQAARIRESVNRYNREGDQFVREFCRASEIVTLDASDRILLSKRHLEHLGATTDVLFVGQFDCIELWEIGQYQRTQLEGESYSTLTERMLGHSNDSL